MKTVELAGQKRSLSTKGALRTLRVGGSVPAVVYGTKKEPLPLSVPAKAFMQLLKSHGTNMIIDLKLDAVKETVLLKEIQRDIITREPIHIDFQRISMTEKIEVSVPLHVTGEAPGVKLAGGILEHILREVRVRCLPTAIPVSLDVDVSSLQINQGLKVKDLKVSEGLEVLTDMEQLILNIVAPTEEETAPAPGTPAPGAAEPEVIAKGKKPEEGAEGAAAAGAAKPAAGAAKPAAGAAPAKPAGKEGK